MQSFRSNDEAERDREISQKLGKLYRKASSQRRGGAGTTGGDISEFYMQSASLEMIESAAGGEEILAPSRGAAGGDVTNADTSYQQNNKFNFFQKNFLVVCFVGIALAIDTSIILISMQAYWNFLTPSHPELYGLAYGCYDLAQFLFAPMFGWLSDKVGMKTCMAIGMFLNVIGNGMYSFALYAGGIKTIGGGESLSGVDLCQFGERAEAAINSRPENGTWQLLLVGRFVAGMGSAVLALGAVFVAKTTPFDQRMHAISCLRVPQTIARMIAPTIAIVFAFSLSTSINSNSTVELIFNFYTVPSWIATGFSALILLAVLVLFDNDYDKKKSLQYADSMFLDNDFAYQEEEEEAAAGPSSTSATPSKKKKKFDTKKAGDLITHTSAQCAIFFFVILIANGIFSNLFSFGIGHQHILSNLYDIWRLYVPVGIGVLSSSLAFRVIRKRKVPDYVTSTLCVLLFAIGCVVMIPTSSSYYYYVGIGIQSLATPIYYPMTESYYTKTITVFEEQTQGRMGLFISLLQATGALARAIGPFITSAIIVVDQSTFSGICKYLGVYPDLTKSYGDESAEYLKGIYQTAAQQGKAVSELCVLTYPSFFMAEGCSVGSAGGIFLTACAGLLGVTFLVQYAGYFRFFRRTIYTLRDKITSSNSSS